MSWSVPAGVIAQGVVAGAITGLLAVGLVLVYRTTRVVNFAYGALGGLAGTVGVLAYQAGHLSWWLCVPGAVVTGALLGTGVERVVIRRFTMAPRLVLTIATVGLAQVLGGAALLLPTAFDRSPLVPSFETPLSTVRVAIDPVVLTGNDLLVLAVVPVVLAGLGWFLLRTDAGMAVRATADNVERALLLGLPVRRLSTLVWSVIGALAALTVMLRAPSDGLTLDAAAGPALLLPALAAAVVAGLTSLPQAFAAGVALGVLDSAVRWNVDKQSVTSVVFLAVILVALAVRRPDRSRAETAGESSWSVSGSGRRLPREVTGRPEWRLARFAVCGLGAAVLLAWPVTASPSALNRASSTVLLGLVAVSLVVLTGWGGTVSLGQFAIVGIGGVVAANLIAERNVDLFLAVAAAGGVGAAVAVLVGLPALRVRGLFLAVTTLALAVAVDGFLLNPRNFGWIPPSFDRPVLWRRFDLLGERPMYYLCLGALVVAVTVVGAWRRTHTGRALLAARDNPRAAAALGIPLVGIRLTGFVAAGALAGVAGALHAVLLRGVGMHTYEPSISLLVFSMAVVGGIGSVGGALAGVALMQGAAIAFPEQALLITGTGLLVVLYALPGGLGQLGDTIRGQLASLLAGRRRGAPGEVAAGGAEVDLTLTTSDGLSPAAADGLLSCRGLTASYGPHQVLFGVDFDVADGEIVALLGPNGAGKSTVLRTIAGLMPATGGTVTVTAGLAVVPGERGVFTSLTVDEHLALATWAQRRTEAERDATRQAALDLFPALAQRRTVAAGNLSGGEQQMLSLAMAFCARPRLLCIDELAIGLAPAVVDLLCDKVVEIHAGGTAIVLVEQSVELAQRLAPRCLFLERGRIRFDGPTADIHRRPDLLRAVFLGGTAPSTPAPAPAPPPVPARQNPTELVVSGVTVHFGGVRALDRVDLVVPPGRVVGLLGHNGAGKTTLFDVVSGFLTPDAGRVHLGDTELTGMAPHRRARAGLGRSFQEARLFPSLTVAETVAVALARHLPNRDPLAAALGLPASLDSEAAAARRTEEILELLGLVGYRDHRAGELSTGTRRIVELACILAQDPSVVLLDEPSAGVAQADTAALGPLLRRVQAATGCSLLVIEHDLGLLSGFCDELVALEQGRVIAAGPPEWVLAHPEVLSSYLGTAASPVRTARG